MNNSRGIEFLAGFLLGGIVGAAVALLMAPQSGEQVREELRERGIELRHRGEEFSGEAMQRASQMAEEGQKRAAEMQDGVDLLAGRARAGARLAHEHRHARVDPGVASANHLGVDLALAQGADAQGQLLHAEGLADVVVRTGLETVYLSSYDLGYVLKALFETHPLIALDEFHTLFGTEAPQPKAKPVNVQPVTIEAP